jgi:hypothetical protein
MTIASSFGLLLIVCGCLPLAARAAPESATTLYLLLDSKKELWCGYHDENVWRASIGEVGAAETASVEFVKGVPKVVKVTEFDDSGVGSWIVFDRYYLNDTGVVLSLQRITNALANNVSRSEVFEARAGGRLALQHVKLRSVETDSPIARSDAPFPKLPMATRVAYFPFGALIERAQEVLAQDSVCVPPREAIEERAHSR